MKAKKLPDFSKMTLEEIARFWDEHDSADYWDQMEEARVEFKEPLDETARPRSYHPSASLD